MGRSVSSHFHRGLRQVASQSRRQGQAEAMMEKAQTHADCRSLLFHSAQLELGWPPVFSTAYVTHHFFCSWREASQHHFPLKKKGEKKPKNTSSPCQLCSPTWSLAAPCGCPCISPWPPLGARAEPAWGSSAGCFAWYAHPLPGTTAPDQRFFWKRTSSAFPIFSSSYPKLTNTLLSIP